MHPSSMENMLWCYRRYAAPRIACANSQLTVLDIGGANVNGSYAELFRGPGIRYVGVDLAPGPGVDIVPDDPYRLPLSDGSVDFVLSGQMLEHSEFFWEAFAEMVRVLKPDGFLFLIAPSAGPIHRYPVDCYRFYPDAYGALARHAKCHLIDLRHDDRGPWNDLVGVFSPTPQAVARPYPDTYSPPAPLFQQAADPQQEMLLGTRPYLEVLADLHKELQPRAYLEIGVRNGRSLQLARCPALGVDPEPDVQVELPPQVEVLRMTSDDFFEFETDRLAALAPDLVFIDGMHLFEFALRDFMHVERLLGPRTVVVIDDVFPAHPAQAQRKRTTRAWTGDIWRLLHVLRDLRPDLVLWTLDTHPTGLLVIAGLDQGNRVLWQRYNPLVRVAQGAQDPPTSDILGRTGALAPHRQALQPGFDALCAFRAAASTPAAREALRVALQPPGTLLPAGEPALAARSALRLTVVLVCFNMAREILRTVRTLSAHMQRGLAESEFEILLTDNGSTEPFDEAACLALAGNLRVLRVPDGGPSPVRAINLALAQARGALIGVFIDGARMASPGLLAGALAAAETHPRPVIGALSFHLGPDIQQRSVTSGYDQAAEDALLEQSGWENDGYRLFDISVLAPSSADGWFTLPAETNALFLKREQWAELGGFEPRFESAGGGLANLDTWARACALPDVERVLLLGEATFHQVHGGVSTNSPVSRAEAFHAEYVRIRHCDFRRPSGPLHVFGSLSHLRQRDLQHSLDRHYAVASSSYCGSELRAAGRAFNTAVPAALLGSIQAGVLRSVYRNIPFLKSPLDIGIYLQLLSRQSPRSVIEIGSKYGGSALWFADMLSAAGIEPRVVSVDIEPLASFEDARIRFLKGDAARLGEVLTLDLLQSLPRPWLVVEDSSHLYEHSLAVLRFFDPHLVPGDMIVVEDGVVRHLDQSVYSRYEDGPSRAVRDFLLERGSGYSIDASMCDFYGHNATYNPNGFLLRTA